jgi:hypothetical protein
MEMSGAIRLAIGVAPENRHGLQLFNLPKMKIWCAIGLLFAKLARIRHLDGARSRTNISIKPGLRWQANE